MIGSLSCSLPWALAAWWPCDGGGGLWLYDPDGFPSPAFKRGVMPLGLLAVSACGGFLFPGRPPQYGFEGCEIARPSGCPDWLPLTHFQSGHPSLKSDRLMSFLLDQFASAFAGYALGLFSGLWLHAIWKWRHPRTIHFWGAWYTDPRILTSIGIGLAVGWAIFLLKSFW
jgi:hypothetical protein